MDDDGGGVLGYYVHHTGDGSGLARAAALARRWDGCVTGLSSLPRPADWRSPWLDLPCDDAGPEPQDLTANERFHHAPEHHDGLLSRMAEIAAWVHHLRPRVVVVDGSVEVVTFVRLLGVPVVAVVEPGARDDAPHVAALGMARACVGFWPDGVTGAVLPGVPPEVLSRVRAVGGMATCAVVRGDGAGERGAPRPAAGAPSRPGGRLVLVLAEGRGAGDTGTDPALPEPGATCDGWRWERLDLDDVGSVEADDCDRLATALRAADVVVGPATPRVVAEIAAARRPAVLVPRKRDHDEEVVLAQALRTGGWPVRVVASLQPGEATEVLTEAAGLDGRVWTGWCDGRAADRFAGVVRRVAARTAVARPAAQEPWVP